MGRYFEDYEIEERFESPGRTLTEADVVNFAGITGDWGEMHTNEEYAERTRFKERVAHGALTFSLATGLVMRTGVIDEDALVGFYGVDSVEFRTPVRIGDTLTAEATVAEKEPRERDGVVTVAVETVNQHGETTLRFGMQVLVEKVNA